MVLALLCVFDISSNILLLSLKRCNAFIKILCSVITFVVLSKNYSIILISGFSHYLFTLKFFSAILPNNFWFSEALLFNIIHVFFLPLLSRILSISAHFSCLLAILDATERWKRMPRSEKGLKHHEKGVTSRLQSYNFSMLKVTLCKAKLDFKSFHIFLS